MTNLRGIVDRVESWRPSRAALIALLVALAAAASGVFTYLTLAGYTAYGPTPGVILELLIVNLALVMLLASLIAWRLVRLWSARRSGIAGARLHVRLVAMFSAIAVGPAILVALFAAVTLNLGVQSWFSERVKLAVSNAVEVANAYVEQSRRAVRADLLELANRVNREAPLIGSLGGFEVRFRQAANFFSFAAADIVDSNGNTLIAARHPLVFFVDPPPREALDQARNGEVVVINDDQDQAVRALVRIERMYDAYLWVTRYQDSSVAEYLQRAQAAAAEYQRLESSISSIELMFAVTYTVVAMVVLLAAIWLGLGAANRLVAPISRLIGAAERVRDGDWSTRVEIRGRGGDEIATLGRAFNRMTEQIATHRNELLEARDQMDQRRRFTEAVLSGVSAGVIGLDRAGRVRIVNPSALALTGTTRDALVGQPLAEIVPEMGHLVRAALADPEGRTQGQVDLSRDGATRNLTVRVTGEVGEAGQEGYVVTFDDITQLVSAQRTAAWADVARRIAHEIKNPLTPIQLSAERLKRKYRKGLAPDDEVFDQCTDTIIRQVSDIGRMVDEFSSFARMPAPVMRDENVDELVRQAAFLMRVAHPAIAFILAVPDEHVQAQCDGRLIAQALTNVIKNAAESVGARFEKDGGEGGVIEIRLAQSGGRATIDVIDNGVGLPAEGRHRLTEPYVTTRAKGTGLGLAIVKKILEDHQGELTLSDAPAPPAGAAQGGGAHIRLSFPQSQAQVRSTEPRHEQERVAHGA